MNDTEHSKRQKRSHDSRGFRRQDFFELLPEEPTRADKANLTRVRGILAQIALKEGGFTPDPEGSFISRDVVVKVIDRLHAGERVHGLKDQSLKVLEELLATSEPLSEDIQGFVGPAEEAR